MGSIRFTWNTLDPITVLPDDAWNVEDLTISDVYKPDETWSGLWTYWVGAADTIKFNTYIMDNRDPSVKAAQNKKTALHELGHGRGIVDGFKILFLQR